MAQAMERYPWMSTDVLRSYTVGYFDGMLDVYAREQQLLQDERIANLKHKRNQDEIREEKEK